MKQAKHNMLLKKMRMVMVNYYKRWILNKELGQWKHAEDRINDIAAVNFTTNHLELHLLEENQHSKIIYSRYFNEDFYKMN